MENSENEETNNEILRINYVRVSEILSHYDAWSFGHIDPDVLSNACERGTQVHAQCTAFVRNLFSIEPSEQVSYYVESFKNWWEAREDDLYINQGEIVLSEKRLYDDELKFSGKADLIYKKDDKFVLIDWKTSASKSTKSPLQLAAYVHLIETNLDIQIDEAKLLHLSKVGKKPRIYSYDRKELEMFKKYFFYLFSMYEYAFVKKGKLCTDFQKI